MTRRALPWASAGAGLALLLTGVVLALTGGASGDLSWTAYTGSYEPLPDTVEVVHLYTGQEEAGAACAVLGLLLLATVGGWALGRRAHGGARAR